MLCRYSITMSLTEVVTLEAFHPRHNSGSGSIRARSPHPPEPPSPARKSSDRGEDIELAELPNADIVTKTTSGASTPPVAEDTKIPWWKAHVQFAALCWALFVAGWNDGTTGPLLPRIQSNYHVCLFF